jgi:hypothetical protein
VSTEREQLIAMLSHAEVRNYQKLAVGVSAAVVTVHTGPDDAIAMFSFDASGRLAAVSVDES